MPSLPSSLGDTAEIGDRRQEVLADAFHQPAARLVVEVALIDVLGQDRADRIGQHQFGLRRQLGERARQAGHGAGAAAAEHDGVQIAAHLLEDLRAGAEFVRGRVVRVAELVDEVGARGLLGDGLGQVLVVLGGALGHVRAGQAHFGAHRLQPFCWATSARPRPVLPAVPSPRVAPGFRSPRCSAASIIDRPMRSLIDPPGLALSSFR
ncbi:hypothetical protein G6F56_013173 [Rhizopus delemar]|nr:hypothetical protein G6F56_013173 [Rhizopus delemar]